MIRVVLLTAAAVLMPSAALADGGAQYDADQGALSGRSPQRAHRLLTPAASCAKARPMLPAGKLPVFGHAPTLGGDCRARLNQEVEAKPEEMRSGS